MTNIWQWIHQLDDELRDKGHDRTADLIYKIFDDDPRQVEAVMPEALAAARSLKNPWLEVYFRHWALQSRVIKSGEGTSALQETASLLEFAHRPETHECPQSICVTQDLAGCYANVDGPGWAKERMALCEETLGRIEPSRNCFDCISREYADALLDLGRCVEARAYLEKQAARMLEAGQEISDGYDNWRARTHLDANEPGQALSILDASKECSERFTEIQRQILRAQCLAELERLEEASNALPAFDSISGGHHMRWAAAMTAIARRQPERNTWQLGNLFGFLVSEFERKGAHRHCLTIALQHGELALMRGSVWNARYALERARLQLPNLRIDAGAAQQIAALEALIGEGGATKIVLPVPAAELMAHLQSDQERNPERDLELVVAASAERPEDADLAMLAAEAMTACGARAKAHTFLWAFMDRNGAVEAVALRLLDIALQMNDAQRDVERLAEFLARENPIMSSWCRARLAYHNNAWGDVITLAEHAIAQHPEEKLIGFRNLAGHAAMSAGDFEKALNFRRFVADNTPEAGSADWDMMIPASIIGDWAAVRQCGARLGMSFDSEEGPIAEDWGWVRLIFVEDGEKKDYFGRRTGPVTARVVQAAPPHLVQHVGDEVVFDAIPQEAAPEDEEERKQWIAPFNVVHVTKDGGFKSWLLDGALPADEQMAAFRDAIEERGWHMWTYSNDEYAVNDPTAKEKRIPGIFFALATPAALAPAEIDAALRSLTAGWSHPWAWRGLAEAAGGDVDHHQHIIEIYGL